MNFLTFFINKKQSYRILLITLALLMIPLIAMQLTPEVSWQIGDFVVAGILLVGLATSMSYWLSCYQESGVRFSLLLPCCYC